MSEITRAGIGMTSQRTRSRLVKRIQQQGIRDLRICEIIGQTPRHLFVDEALAHRAYEDTALPIGFSQTISQPYIVARMSELILGDMPLKRVLEVGSGSGYQAAVLAQLADQVISIERIKPLLNKTKQLLYQLSIRNVQLIHQDGAQGWAKAAPYCAIVITAAAAEVPAELLSQLKDGGRLVMPVEQANDPEQQCLRLVVRNGNQFIQTDLEVVKFVPLLPGIYS